MSTNKRRVPLWMLLLIIIAALPVVLFPAMLSASPEDDSGIVAYLWLYPAYVAAAGILAWQCYGRRSEMTWILLILMILTHVAMCFLVFD